MNAVVRIILLGTILVPCAVGHSRADEIKFALPRETARLKASSGSEFASAQCLLCHSADYISTQPKLSRAVWKATVLKMQQKYGAPISTNNVEPLVEYLTRNYGAESPGKN